MSHQSDPVPSDAAAVDAIELQLVSRTVDLAGMKVHRVLPSIKRQMVGPFIFFDQMGPVSFARGQGLDVLPHPHINLATLTYLLEGSLHHRDSLGTDQLILPGAVNWMKAGSGIVHSERSDAAARHAPQQLSGIQTWVALPEAQEEDAPQFIHHDASELPEIAAEGVTVRQIAGAAFGVRSPLVTASETLYADIQLIGGAKLVIEPTVTERAIYIISGELEVDGTLFAPAQLLVLRPGQRIDAHAPQAARILLLGGEPMEGPRWIWWNFVSSRKERIEQAREEWRSGRFDTVPGDEIEFTPAPEDNSRPRKALGGIAFA